MKIKIKDFKCLVCDSKNIWFYGGWVLDQFVDQMECNNLDTDVSHYICRQCKTYYIPCTTCTDITAYNEKIGCVHTLFPESEIHTFCTFLGWSGWINDEIISRPNWDKNGVPYEHDSSATFTDNIVNDPYYNKVSDNFDMECYVGDLQKPFCTINGNLEFIDSLKKYTNNKNEIYLNGPDGGMFQTWFCEHCNKFTRCCDK